MNLAQGGTAQLPAIYKDEDGALTDPVSPRVDIINPSAVVVVNDAALVRDGLGEYHYSFTAPVDAPLGHWIARFFGEVNGATITGDEPFDVVLPGSVNADDTNLITLEEFLDAQGKLLADLEDNEIRAAEAAIRSASEAIRTYTDRDFGTPSVTGDRVYAYDESGILDIDDASAVTELTLINDSQERTLTSLEWRAQPYGAPVYTWIDVTAPYGFSRSPEMGFNRNEDVYYSEAFPGAQPLIRVTGTWGWPVVPADVKRATIWTAAAMAGSAEDYISEAISGYSRTKGFVPTESITKRAQAILAPYIRIKV